MAGLGLRQSKCNGRAALFRALAHIHVAYQCTIKEKGSSEDLAKVRSVANSKTLVDQPVRIILV